MIRWDRNKGKQVEKTGIDEFLKEILEVCKKHNLSISHEDSQGSFIITRFNKGDYEWLNSAMVEDRE